MKKNILIISTYYPPILSIASNRIFSFAKYLDKEKYNIHIITFDSNLPINEEDQLEGVNIIRVSDTPFLKKAGFTKKTNWIFHKMKALYNKIYSCFFTDYSSWKKKSIKLGSELAARGEVDVIISSYAPVAAHLVALEIKRKHKNIMWIADMRDEMSENPYLLPIERKSLLRQEQIILANCDALISVSYPILDAYRKISTNKNCVYKEIRNGYDFEIENVRKMDKLDYFTIVYTGSFYGDISPDNFLKALEQVVTEYKMEDIQVKFFGVTKSVFVPENIKNIVKISGKVEYVEVLHEQKRADLLLLISPTNLRKGVYTGKVFEYLASLNPILALVPKNDVAERLIKEANAGYIATNENIEDIKARIVEAYYDWKNEKAINPNIEIIKKHHRYEQVKRLEVLLEALLND